MAKGSGGKSGKAGTSAKSQKAAAQSVVVGLPENDPVVVDNPRFRIDLINLKGGAGGGPQQGQLQREFAGMSQLVIFDSEGTHEWRFIELEAGKDLQLVLFDDERITFKPKGQKILIKPSRGSEFIQNDFSQSQFSLVENPDRRIKAFCCEGTDLATKEVFDGMTDVKLSDKGRHVVVLIPGPKRFGAIELL